MNFPGRKWLMNADYLSDADKQKVLASVERCRECFPGERVKVRPSAYIGEPASIATVCYGPGERIFEIVHR